MKEQRLLIIDDEPGICELISDIGESCHYTVASAHGLEAAQKGYQLFNPTLIFLDLNLGHEDGIEFLRFLVSENYKHPLVLMSGADERILGTAQLLGKSQGLTVLTTLPKPFKIITVKEILDSQKHISPNSDITKLIAAIDNQQFVMHYQPKISLRTHKTVGVEALVRWQTNEHELLYPDSFIPLAEEHNLIEPLTMVTIERSFAFYRELSQNQITIPIAINLSQKLLTKLSLPDELLAIAKGYEVNPQHIIFEITETAAIEQEKYAMDVLARIRLKGFMLAIDDFGIGYSSLQELYQMPFNELKIDRSFIRNLDTDRAARIIINSIIELAHNLNMQVVAEGVETETLLKILTELKCDVAQGYYFSRPLASEELKQWLLQQGIEK